MHQSALGRMSQAQPLSLVEITRTTASFQQKEWCRLILDQGISDDPFERHIV